MRKRISVWLAKLYIHYCARVDPKSKCPGCGHRLKHPVLFSRVHQKLIHRCGFCGAAWAQPPVVQAAAWSLPAREESEPESPRVSFGAQREPVRVKAN